MHRCCRKQLYCNCNLKMLTLDIKLLLLNEIWGFSRIIQYWHSCLSYSTTQFSLREPGLRWTAPIRHYCCGPDSQGSSFHVHSPPFSVFQPQRLADVVRRLKVGSGHFSSLHLVVYLSLCEPNLSPAWPPRVNHNIDSLPSLSTCQGACRRAGEAEARRETDTWKALRVVKMVV